jgi:integrase
MTYIAAMYGFDIAARAGEATSPDGESEQHTILCEDVVIHLTEKIRIEGQWIERVRGGDEATLERIEIDNVNTLEICALTHKVGQINTTKRIARNSEEEAQFLEDLMEFMKHSGAGAKDPLFSRNTKKPNGVMSKKKCRPKMVTEAIKTEVTAQGLPPLLFSFHSLRKGAVTHMKALGVSREETLARGNYSANSAMIDTVYNYNSAGTGPLGAMANKKGREPSREDVSRTIRLNYSG